RSSERGGGGSEHHAVALGEMLLRERDSLGPQLGFDVADVHLVGEILELDHGVTAREFEGALANGLKVAVVLTHRDETQLHPAEADDVAERDEPAAEGAATDVEDACAAQQGVVYVKEGDHGRIAGPDVGCTVGHVTGSWLRRTHPAHARG